MSIETDGNAAENVADLTSEEGKSDAGQDLTEEKTVAGLSRKITSLKKALAEATSSPKNPDEQTVKELAESKSKLARYETALKYPDIAQQLDKMMQKGLRPEDVDDELIEIIRGGTRGEETFSESHNIVNRGRELSQDKQDEAALRALKSLF